MNSTKIVQKVLIVFGTRPEAIKLAPVIMKFKSRPDIFETIVCVTGQHREMLDQVLGLFEIVPDFDLNIMKAGQDLFDVTARVLLGMRTVLDETVPDLVLVHGDTSTSSAAALAAFYKRIPVGHVEAGLRTHQKYSPWPEEVNRQITARIASFHFAPTEISAKNLEGEGIERNIIFVTGNTVIDALLLTVEKIKDVRVERSIEDSLVAKFPELKRLGLSAQNVREGRRLILVTGHRRENFGQGFESMCAALAEIADHYPDVDILYPVHLNPNVQEPVRRILGQSKNKNIYLIDPVDYLPFVFLMKKSFLIITDSGGVQEEAPSLGKPVLVTRDTTERPEAVIAGTVKLVGTRKENIVSEVDRLLNDPEFYKQMASAKNPYGDGRASDYIVDAFSC